MAASVMPAPPLRPGRTSLWAGYVFFVAVIARTLAQSAVDQPGWLPVYAGLGLTSLALFSVVQWRPALRPRWLHLYFSVQSGLILALVSLHPHRDYVTALFVLLSFQVALVFTGRTRWLWCGIFILAAAGSLMVYLGILYGLGLAMTPIAGCIVFPAYVIANHDIEIAHAESQTMLGQLQETHQHLQAYASQIEELAAMEERNRLARELHDSVSQIMFSINLSIRSARIMLERDPASARPQLEQLQTLTHTALAEMRSLIAQLRPETNPAPPAPTASH
jgi:signal transduction histidine kinase